MINHYGETNNDEKLKKIQVCRDITKKIIDFGVNDDQILMIIKFLSYELENVEKMKLITDFIKELDSDIMFVGKEE
jgi:hypothetical protein